ncbi:cytochrome c [Rhizobium sp. L1K21]|uniref:c-type cytochrome n=1 Tax=Rhizobium sp. L1K21 TaxID=2954933 RepID=UPI002091EA89|nr:cytochrome c [Rhizobium sp. L1K21]MCO6184785.1 cytochrome c [Rhizobium sp. L1K21]
MKYRRELLAVLVIAVAGAAYMLYATSQPTKEEAQMGSAEPLVSITVPTSYSDSAIVGKRVFDAKCATCHGENAVGQNGVAPPLIHIIYEPNHHGDEAFQRAAAMGVRAHHWPFGDMPQVEGVSRADIANVVAYIREIQRANGIE